MEKSFKETLLAVLRALKKSALPAYAFCWIILLFAAMAGAAQTILSLPVYFLLAALLAIAIFYCGIFAVIENAAFKNNKNLFNGFGAAWSSFISIFVVFVLFGALGFGMVKFSQFAWLYFFASFLLMPLLILIIPGIILRDEGPVSSFITAFNLLKGAYLPALGYYILFGALSFAAVFIIYNIIAAFGIFAPPPPPLAGPELAQTTAEAAPQSFNFMLNVLNNGSKGVTGIILIFLLQPLTVILPAVFTIVIMLNLEHRLNPQEKENLMRKLEKEESYKARRVSNPGVFDTIPLKDNKK